jgi:hypothetical protein
MSFPPLFSRRGIGCALLKIRKEEKEKKEIEVGVRLPLIGVNESSANPRTH